METKNIYKKLAEFQQECPVIQKGTKGYGYNYADLPSIFEIINPLLKKYNLGFTQLLIEESLKTILFDIDSGETIESCVHIKQDVKIANMNAFQVLGSAITYYRRYSLAALLGIITDEDNDANSKTKTTKTTNNKKAINRRLTLNDVSERWNGKIYAGKYIFINDEKIEVDPDQLENLKKHKKYIPEGKK